MLTDWSQQLAAALTAPADAEATAHPEAGTSHSGPGPASGLEIDADLVDLVLDLARDAAHAVDRPAAPLTTFLVGYAAALRGGGTDAVAECAAIARQLALTWEAGSTPGAGPDDDAGTASGAPR